MANKLGTDKFANIAYLYVAATSNDVLATARLDMANNLLSEKAAIIISRADVFIGNVGAINAAGESISVALQLTDRLTTISLADPETLFTTGVIRYDAGTAGTGNLWISPIVLDFSNLPGGGILVPADRLYIAVKSENLAALANAAMRIYYTVVPLAPADYWELIEARRIMTT